MSASCRSADKVRITEDSIEKTIDKVGIVRSITKFRGYRQDFLDEREGIAGADVVVEENGAPVLLVVRLKIEDEKITEIETVATRSRAEGSIFNIDGVQNTTAAMNHAPKKSQLNSREEMIRIALLYPAGLEAENLVKVDAPFTPEAYRLENGEFMAGPDCKRNEDCKNIRTQSLGRQSAARSNGALQRRRADGNRVAAPGVGRRSPGARGHEPEESAGGVGILQDLRRKDPRRRGVHEERAGGRGFGLAGDQHPAMKTVPSGGFQAVEIRNLTGICKLRHGRIAWTPRPSCADQRKL